LHAISLDSNYTGSKFPDEIGIQGLGLFSGRQPGLQRLVDSDMYTGEIISSSHFCPKNHFTAEPLSAQSEGYFIRIPERGILIKGTRLFNETAINCASVVREVKRNLAIVITDNAIYL